MVLERSAQIAPPRLQQLVPAGVVLVCADPARDQLPLHAAEAACVAHAVPSRQREFAAGRHAARLALERLGIRPFALLPDAQRVPRWPAGIVGSIAHCEGCCVVGVAREGQVAGLGLDVEPATPLDVELHALVASPRELTGRCDAGIDLAKLLFCAKEAFYKCYFPCTRRALEFRDVEVALGELPSPLRAGSFRVALLAADAPPLPGGARALEGRYLRDGAFLLTAVTLLRQAPG